MSPARRQQGYRAYGRAADAFDAVAWRAPSSKRFEASPANDYAWRVRPERADAGPDLPRWVIVFAGAVVAAVVGAMLGGLLAV